MRVLLTRAKADAARTAVRLEAAGHAVICAPVIEIMPTGVPLPDEAFDAIIATSAHAIDGIILPNALRGSAWLVVGERLAAMLREHGLGEAEIAAPDVASLLAAIDEEYPEQFRFLYPAGHDRKPDLEAGVAQRGHDLRVIETYAAQPVTTFDAAVVDAIREGRIDAVLHYSRRSAELFVAQANAAGLCDALARVRHVAISADAAAPLAAQGWSVEIAQTPDEAAMLAKIE